MAEFYGVLRRKLEKHSFLTPEDIAGLQNVTGQTRELQPNEEIVHQGDKPQMCIVVLDGMLARFHTLREGDRQYLSLHIAGDLPDAQGLFLDVMDHAVCAIDHAQIFLMPHKELMTLFVMRPALTFAFWRETLIDAAIFREAITNNSSRPVRARMAHFFAEQYYRAHSAGVAKKGECRLPLNQAQIGQALGMSLVTVNRTIQNLRATECVELRDGTLRVRDWVRLSRIGEFDPTYLHLKKELEL